jgi:tetraprenyl-beta-curcumene synthase
MTSELPSPRRQAALDRLALLVLLMRYWRTIFPIARRELRRWDRRAAAIPDPFLRTLACETLVRERGLCEGAALFAILAPRRNRAAVVRLLVTVEVLCDYLDSLAERDSSDVLADSRRLHAALIAALGGSAPAEGYFGAGPADGGYLEMLVAHCQEGFLALPKAVTVAPFASYAAVRSGEGQSHNHAAMLGRDETALAAWCRAHTPVGAALAWWELAAAACSSLTLIALVACAANPATRPEDAARVGAAYFPWISALSSLFDSVADATEDVVSGNHSYVAHYATPAVAAERLGTLTAQAITTARALPHGRQHVWILAAMACFYLVSPQVPGPVRRAVLSSLELDTRLLLLMLRLRRAFVRP